MTEEQFEQMIIAMNDMNGYLKDIRTECIESNRLLSLLAIRDREVGTDPTDPS